VIQVRGERCVPLEVTGQLTHSPLDHVADSLTVLFRILACRTFVAYDTRGPSNRVDRYREHADDQEQRVA